MPWREINGSSYYYQIYREGGKVRNRFIGNGPIAEVVEATDKYLAARRRSERLWELAQLEGLRQFDAQLGLREFVALIDAIYRALMNAAGYHRHCRGKWRKRRMSDLAVRESPQPPAVRPSKPTAWERNGILTKEDFARLVPDSNGITDVFHRAADGDPSVLAKLRLLLDIDEDGTLAKFYTADSGEKLQWLLAQKAAGDDLALRESLRVECDRIREMMEGENPTASERLLADRVAISWLNLRRYEIGYALYEHKLGEKMREEYQRNIARGNRDYLAAIQAMANVRKLALPVLQFQLNMNSIGQQKMINNVGAQAPRNQGAAS